MEQQPDKLTCFDEVRQNLNPLAVPKLEGQAPAGTDNNLKLKAGMNAVVELYLDNREPMAPTLIWAPHIVEAAIAWFCNLTVAELNALNN
jgi:hypothetical protein